MARVLAGLAAGRLALLGLLLVAYCLPPSVVEAAVVASNAAAAHDEDRFDADAHVQTLLQSPVVRSLQDAQCTDMTWQTFTDEKGEKRDCAWLAGQLQNNSKSARTEYCSPPAGYRLPLSAVICPVTCGIPCPSLADKCKDTSAIIGRVALKKRKKCSWIAKSARRLAKYCSRGEVGIRTRADAACPKTCQKCGQGMLVTAKPTSNPTELPTELPTKAPSRSPTKNPTKAPSRSPTSRPTKAPTPVPPTPVPPTPVPPTHRPPSRAPTPADPCAESGDPNSQSCQLSATLRCVAPDGTPCNQMRSTMQCAERPKRLRFRFSGGQCWEGNNNQGRDLKCLSAFDGTIGLKAARITVLGTASDGSVHPHLYTVRQISLGDEFEVFGAKILPDTPNGELRDQITVVIQDKGNKIRQSMAIKMDCTRYELAYGNRFGALDLLGYQTESQGIVPTSVKIQYEYHVENSGKQDANIQALDTTRHGKSESLVFDMGVQNPRGSTPLSSSNVGVCEDVTVVKTERINLARKQSYSTTVNVKAQNSASLPCGASTSFSFTAGDSN